jgi:protein-disulfide isomerase
MAQSKTDVGSLIIVAALALIIGIGTGALLSGEAGTGTGPGRDQPQGEPQGGQPPMNGDQAGRPPVMELPGNELDGIDRMLEDRFLEVAALERLAARAELRVNGPTAGAARPQPAPAPKPVPKVQPERPKVVPRVVGKDIPQPAVAPTPPAQPEAPEVTSAAALARQSKYTTALGDSPAIGPDSAPVKVFIISDFQCPVCRRAANGGHELFDQFGNDVQWIFWQNPLDMHRKALPTAMASMAAFKQGKFWEYHDKLFQNQRASEPDDLLRFAQELGLNMEQFKADLTSPELEKKIRSDQAAAEKIGARGTPAFLINGRLQVGWGSAAGIGSMVKREQEEMAKLMADGAKLQDALAKRAAANGKQPEEAPVFIAHFLEGKPAERAPEAK